MLWKPTCGRSSLGGEMTTLWATAFLSLSSSPCARHSYHPELHMEGAKGCVPLSQDSFSSLHPPVLSDLLQLCSLQCCWRKWFHSRLDQQWDNPITFEWNHPCCNKCGVWGEKTPTLILPPYKNTIQITDKIHIFHTPGGLFVGIQLVHGKVGIVSGAG